MRALLKKRFLVALLLLVFIGVVVFIFKVPRYYYSAPNVGEPNWGVTFSKKYAQELHLDWKEAYLAILEELNVSHLRIPVYWDDIEKERGAINLNDYKFMLDEAEKRDVNVVLAIGQRLPRWPECHTPEWYEGIQSKEKEDALFNMLEVVVKSFVEYENITHWQVENEPLVRWFGICPPPDADLVAREITFVKTFDERPILVTDSGELGTWRGANNLGGDLLGITTYRVTWNSLFRYVRYPLPASAYQLKSAILDIPWNNVISAELQAEPWIPGTKGITETSLETQYQSMSLEQFKANIEYGRALEVRDAYLWGAEWWYWLKIQGESGIWIEAKTLWK